MRVAVVVAAGACAQDDGVQGTGANSYLLTENYSRGLFESARNKAVSRAGDYCFQMNRRVLILEVAHGSTWHGAGSVQVAFRCLYRGDPELPRGT